MKILRSALRLSLWLLIPAAASVICSSCADSHLLTSVGPERFGKTKFDWPDNYPLPQYPGSSVSVNYLMGTTVPDNASALFSDVVPEKTASRSGATLAQQADDDLEKISRFYTEWLKQNNWTISQANCDDKSLQLQASNGKYNLQLTGSSSDAASAYVEAFHVTKKNYVNMGLIPIAQEGTQNEPTKSAAGATPKTN